jgi:hypothetical protein
LAETLAIRTLSVCLPPPPSPDTFWGFSGDKTIWR